MYLREKNLKTKFLSHSQHFKSYLFRASKELLVQRISWCVVYVTYHLRIKSKKEYFHEITRTDV